MDRRKNKKKVFFLNRYDGVKKNGVLYCEPLEQINLWYAAQQVYGFGFCIPQSKKKKSIKTVAKEDTNGEKNVHKIAR